MAVYSRLLLSSGGGIVSDTPKARQEEHTATLLIGLGGTGIDCLRTIKTQVYSRLIPDDPEASEPRYEHIRFLGVDRYSCGSDDDANPTMAPLEDPEFFSIDNPELLRIFANYKGLEKREELSWLRWEDIDVPELGSPITVIGLRQVGRFMMMDKSRAFMNRVEEEIIAARAGITDPKVNIHIFSGLCGGTGAGCFLDVCYMVRHIADRLGGAAVFGYFFLPDVNLSVIPFSDSRSRAFVSRNGYAAMQELDYCMGLRENGGGFTQMYQDHTEVAWKEPPVDMCHLICASDASGSAIGNAYDYAMSVTTEYVMDFLTRPVGSDAAFTLLPAQLSGLGLRARAAEEEKATGSTLAYCVIGGACACIPWREINTYLASALFEWFSCIGGNAPTRADVEKLAIAALARNASGVDDIYNFLYQELCFGFDRSFSPYLDDWKYVRDYGSQELITHYVNQKAVKCRDALRNSGYMSSAGSAMSLINRIREQLAAAIRDIERGPVFASGMISGGQGCNLLTVVDTLLKENTERWNQERAQGTLYHSDYQQAQLDFDQRRRRGLLDSDQKRFDDYEYALMMVQRNEVDLCCYQEMDNVLRQLRKQLVEADAFYRRLARVMDTLIQTFRENREALSSEGSMRPKESFAVPMMTVDELRRTLDNEVDRVNVPSVLDQFMSLFLDHEDAWIAEDEDKITGLVSRFFVDTVFHGFARRTITELLRDKYGLDSDEQLSAKLYEDWIRPLTEKARPLFPFNGEVWPESRTDRLAFLSVPGHFNPISAAARRMSDVDAGWTVRESPLTDRVLAVCCAWGLPMRAYLHCAEYENVYFSWTAPGVHSYEGKPVPGMSFNDWRGLLPLAPQSQERVSEPVRQITTEARNPDGEAGGSGNPDGQSPVRRPDMEFRAMRRKRQTLSERECAEILERGSSGVLAVLGDGGYPYAVPLSYVYHGGSLYIHCAQSGHKLDAVRECDKVSFCVVDQDRVVPEQYTTWFRSVIVFGRASVMADGEAIRDAIERLAVKYAPDDSAENRDAAIRRELDALCMVKIEVEHMTGKAAIELVGKKP